MADQVVPAVYAKIAAVSADLAQAGISKDRKNLQQGYNFRGVDDVYNALAPVLAKHGLVVLPRILTRECTERQTQKGGTLFYVVVEAEFDFVAAIDGSKHTARTFGEAMDSGDKATNKAMSAAYKYVAFQAFCIPTEGDNDADAHTPEPAVRAQTSAPTAAPAPTASGSTDTISDAQAKRLYAIAKGKGWSDADLRGMLKEVWSVSASRDILKRQYNDIVAAVERGPAAVGA